LVYAAAADGEQVRAVATAADLGQFGSANWMRSVVLDYSNHFAALKNAAATLVLTPAAGNR